MEGYLTIGDCFPIVFWKFLWEDKAVVRGSPLGKILVDIMYTDRHANGFTHQYSSDISFELSQTFISDVKSYVVLQPIKLYPYFKHEPLRLQT